MINQRHSCRTSNRRGTIYIVVLGVTLIVAVMAAVGMSIARLDARVNRASYTQQEARLLAQSAVEYAVNWIALESSWRSVITSGAETSPIALGGGTISWKVIDKDGDFEDDLRDHVEVQGIGRVGDAVAVESVTLMPSGPLTCLEAALHVNDDIQLADSSSLDPTVLTTNQMISSNGNVDATANFASINGDVEVGGSSSGVVNGSTVMGITPRQMAGAEVFDYYKAVGTWIDIDALPDSGGFKQISGSVLSAGNNPFGATNPQGIYVIDCQGEAVRIESSRIVATLVLLNNTSTSNTANSVAWSPAIPNYPALLVENGFEFQHSASSLSEQLTLTNFNPAHTPYNDQSDSDALDTYPSVINGLVYVGIRMEVLSLNQPKFNGVVVAEDIKIETSATLNYSDIFLNIPPPGFTTGDPMQILRGTWRRAAYDY